MRIMYIDIDSLRPDHLGCYGYHRDTSPHIDQVAADGVRFENCYVSDAPCLPSRTALWSGRVGFKTGVVGHGGTAAEPFVEGADRGFRDTFAATSWMAALRRAGYRTVTVSPFGERHAAWHWYAGYTEIYNTGKRGMERADEVATVALDWLARYAASDNWFLHVNFWDPHTPYRTPEDAGNPFAEDALPGWITEEVIARAQSHTGMHCAQELNGWMGAADHARYPRVPEQIDSMDAVRQQIDGYDTGIRYADHFVGQLVAALDKAGVLDETVIMIGADHGENQGEIGVWGDHQTADHITCRVPLIVRWPGVTDTPANRARVDTALHYHFDWAATLIELADRAVPENWDGQPFTGAFRAGEQAGRDYLVVSQNAHVCQRGVRWTQAGSDYLCIRTYHDGYKLYEDVMLFDLTRDPHEQHNLATEQPDMVNQAMAYLAEWQAAMMRTSTTDVDPMMTVLREGGPLHARGMLPDYLPHLRRTNRTEQADRLAAKYPADAHPPAR
jgi:choline-sulfatase